MKSPQNQIAKKLLLKAAFWVTIILIISIGKTFAQKINEPITWKANHFGQEHGLLQQNVKGIALDSMGFLWVGTEDGLHRFNGYEFKSFVHNPNDSTSLKDDHIRGLLFAKNRLWLATTAQGIGIYNPSENQFYDPVNIVDSDDFNTTYKVLRHNKDILIFSAQNHLICYNTESEKSNVFDLPLSGKIGYATDIQHVSENKCWISTTASGLLEMDTKKMELTQQAFLKDHFINSLIKIHDKVYLGTETGMYEYSLSKEKLIQTSLKKPTNCFYQRSAEEIFIGTDVGMFLFNPKANELTPVILNAGENRMYESVDINQIIGDERGNLWIGTEGDGLLYYNSYQKKFNTVKVKLQEYPMTTDISTFQILMESKNTQLLGTKHGVVRYNSITQKFKFFQSTRDILIYTLKRDKNGDVWAGGFTSGLLKFNVKKDSFEKIIPKGTSFTDNDIIEIIPVDSSELWICTWSGGIYTFDTRNYQMKELVLNGKQINRARTSFIDSNNNIWLGTDEGVYKISGQENVEHYNSETPLKLSSDRIFGINEDKNGNIWLGTNVGLTKIDIENNSSKVYYQQKGLPNDFIYSILIDDSNQIWVSTNYGISVLNQEFETFKNYTISDGLQHNEFNGKAGSKDNNGVFYFAGISGLNIFEPLKVVENPFLPQTYIESVELFNKNLGVNELYKNELRFRSKENVLTFNYTALNYLNPEKCSYQYQMDGFDTDWRPVTKQRSTTYTNLDPGEYTFKVRASNDVGKWNIKPAVMKIIIVPPWYKTNLFKAIFIFVFLMSGLLFYFYQTQKLKRDKIKLEKIVLHRTQQIKEKNEKLTSAFEEAANQRDSIAFLMKELRHRVKNNLQIISSLLNIQSNTVNDDSATKALKMAKNRIIAISQIENKISSENESIDVGEFIREISEGITGVLSGEENLKYKLKMNLCSVQLKRVNTTLIGLILNELITNVTKYAFDEYKSDNVLKIGCATNSKELVVTLIDNGKGYDISNVRKNSLGLELVHDMVRQLKGTLKIENQNGTKNTIVIPI